jgi:dihydroorotate dehydrogenase electron transfer subunit
MEETYSQQKASVTENKNICTDHWHLILRNESIAKRSIPGQFVNLCIGGREDLRLRRPFSIALTHAKESIFEVVYQVVGKGTLMMTNLIPGDVVDLLGPFGKGFQMPDRPMSCLLLGGGCGVAPLWGLAECLRRNNNRIIALLGFQSSDRVFGEEFFQRCCAEVTVTTDDGSYGLPGFVSEHLEEALSRKIDRVFACGPPAMLRAIVPIVKKAKVKGELAWEEKMGCGFGVCLSCVVPVLKNGIIERQRTCIEGPIFDIEEIQLNDEI